ncbi:hypothetical protein IJV79_00970 [bacterium]|nr:hypothetical protein [bacterium]
MTKIIINKNKFSKIKAEIENKYYPENTIVLYSKLQYFLFFLMLNISDRDYTHLGQDVLKGQIFISKKDLYDSLKISYEGLNEMMKALKNNNYIDYEDIKRNKSTYYLITICDCDSYKIEFEG